MRTGCQASNDHAGKGELARQRQRSDGRRQPGQISTPIFFQGARVFHAAFQNAGPWNSFQKVVRSVVLAASRLGRSMAELFGLLAKLAIGIPLRQRYRYAVICNAVRFVAGH